MSIYLLTNMTNTTKERAKFGVEGHAMTERMRAERLQIMLSPEELTVLDDFRFKRRMPSRASAVRELLKRGLAAEGFNTATYGSKSSEFGVVGKTPVGRR
jgi:hypothetical protein